MKGFLSWPGSWLTQSRIVAKPYPNGPGVLISWDQDAWPIHILNLARRGSVMSDFADQRYISLVPQLNIHSSIKGEPSQDLPFNLPTSYHLSSKSATALPEIRCFIIYWPCSDSLSWQTLSDINSTSLAFSYNWEAYISRPSTWRRAVPPSPNQNYCSKKSRADMVSCSKPPQLGFESLCREGPCRGLWGERICIKKIRSVIGERRPTSTPNTLNSLRRNYRSTLDSRSNLETKSWRRNQENKTVSQSTLTYKRSLRIHQRKQPPTRRRGRSKVTPSNPLSSALLLQSLPVQTPYNISSVSTSTLLGFAPFSSNSRTTTECPTTVAQWSAVLSFASMSAPSQAATASPPPACSGLSCAGRSLQIYPSPRRPPPSPIATIPLPCAHSPPPSAAPFLHDFLRGEVGPSRAAAVASSPLLTALWICAVRSHFSKLDSPSMCSSISRTTSFPDPAARWSAVSPPSVFVSMSALLSISSRTQIRSRRLNGWSQRRTTARVLTGAEVVDAIAERAEACSAEREARTGTRRLKTKARV